MRPSDIEATVELYECFDCGRRVEESKTKRCEDCGSQLRNLGMPRDL